MFPAAPPPPLPHTPPVALVRIMQMEAPEEAIKKPFRGIRTDAQKQAALTLGIQAGARWRYETIDGILGEHAAQLNQIFNFGPFLINGGRVMPPVVTRTGSSFTIKNPELATAALATFRIVAPARIVTTPPSWRDYLIHHYAAIQRPNPVLLPRNKKERALWIATVKQGWEIGVKQANDGYRQSLDLLTRDLLGVARFRWLSHEGIVSLPYLAVGNMGIRINQNTLTVGGRVYRISAPSAWVETSEWQAKGATLAKPQGF